MLKSGFSGMPSRQDREAPPVDFDDFHAPRGLLDPLDGLARLLDLELARPPRLDEALDVPVNRITAILHGQRGVTADTALRLARYFGTTPQVWLNLQKTYELRRAEIKAGHQIAERVRPRQTAA